MCTVVVINNNLQIFVVYTFLLNILGIFLSHVPHITNSGLSAIVGSSLWSDFLCTIIAITNKNKKNKINEYS